MFIQEEYTLNRIKSDLGFYLTRANSLISEHDLTLLYCNAMTLLDSCSRGESNENQTSNNMVDTLRYIKHGGSYDSFTFFCIGAFLALFDFCLFGNLHKFNTTDVHVLKKECGFQVHCTRAAELFDHNAHLVLSGFLSKYNLKEEII